MNRVPLSSLQSGEDFINVHIGTVAQRAGLRHLIDLADIPAVELRRIVDAAAQVKIRDKAGIASDPILAGKYVALMFGWPATRTRLHFETATRDLGGTAIAINIKDTPIARGESIGDTARVLSRSCSLIMFRTGNHGDLEEMAKHSECPVINGCTSYSHPFRILVEVMTYEENRGPIAGKAVAFFGDCHMNQATSWIHGAAKFGFSLRLACPPEFSPRPEVMRWAKACGAHVDIFRDAGEAADCADYICTDIWVPFGHEDREARLRVLAPYQVNTALMQRAKPDAIFMHPLAARRDDEVTADVIDGAQSVVWTGGIENKRYLLKALFAWQLSGLATPSDHALEEASPDELPRRVRGACTSMPDQRRSIS